jgi:hypothetical protein
MINDDRDFIERADSITENMYGQPMSIDLIAESFALYGLNKRVAALERFDGELRDEIDGNPQTLRRRAQLMELRRKMGSIHDALRKAER